MAAERECAWENVMFSIVSVTNYSSSNMDPQLDSSTDLCAGYSNMKCEQSLKLKSTYHFQCKGAPAVEKQYIRVHWTLLLAKHSLYHQGIAHKIQLIHKPLWDKTFVCCLLKTHARSNDIFIYITTIYDSTSSFYLFITSSHTQTLLETKLFSVSDGGNIKLQQNSPCP